MLFLLLSVLKEESLKVDFQIHKEEVKLCYLSLNIMTLFPF